jgi:hypothetical protein
MNQQKNRQGNDEQADELRSGKQVIEVVSPRIATQKFQQEASDGVEKHVNQDDLTGE